MKLVPAHEVSGSSGLGPYMDLMTMSSGFLIDLSLRALRGSAAEEGKP